MSKRFLFTLAFILIVAAGSALAIFLAKGYRFSSKTGTVAGTGIISINSIPDQASVYIDGHLTTATNANINNLLPKDYDVKIQKDGFIPWDKKIAVKEGLVSQVKATLFPAIPTVYPLTFNGVSNVTLSPDYQRVAYIVTQEDTQIVSSALKKSGIWVWDMTTSGPISFASGPEPHRVADLISGVDYSKAILKFSPDSSQILVTLPDRSLLLDIGSFNDTGKDITAVLQPTLKSWDTDQKTRDKTLIDGIKDIDIQKEASSSSYIRWSPDQTKYLSSEDGKNNFKVTDLADNKSYNIPSANFLQWLGDSRHLIMVEDQTNQGSKQIITPSKVSIIEFDGANKSEIYVGNIDQSTIFSWPDSSRLVVVSSVPTQTGNLPNLFGINLK